MLSHSTIVTCLGDGIAPTIAALRSGASGLQPCDFETAALPTYIGKVAELDRTPISGALQRYDCRNNRLIRRALDQDGFRAAVDRLVQRFGAHRIGVLCGSSTAGILQAELSFRHRNPDTGALPSDFHYAETHNIFSVADFVQRELGLTGIALSVSAACASTAKAFGNAVRMIGLGFCDAAIVGGADSLCLTTLYGFRALQLTAETPCRPFDIERSGISIAEAAGFVVLQRLADSEQTGIALVGLGESSDAYHMSSPHPEGHGARRAMEAALASAALSASQIDYINLHGTATRVGDSAEDQAIVAVFGRAVPCNSTKGLTGHTLGAAGVIEAIISAACLRKGFIPVSAGTNCVDPTLKCNYVIGGNDLPITLVMSNSFGFGGSNCSLILGRIG